MCGTCADSTSGPCQDAQHTCFAYASGTTCPAGTVACGVVNPNSVPSAGDFALLRADVSGISADAAIENQAKITSALNSLLPGTPVTVLYVAV